MKLAASQRLRIYAAIAGMAPKLAVAYRAWFWMGLFVQIVALTIFVFFWRGVYGERATLGDLTLRQTLNYIMLAQVLLPAQVHLVYRFGELLARGQFAVEMLRPLDLQARFYFEELGFLLVDLVQRLPLALYAWLAFGLQVPSDPAVWAAFLVSLLLGHAVVYLFSFLFACLAFYTTETWGLSMVQQSVVTFFSGALVPLSIMPAWLQALALSLPFAQGLWVPASLLAEIRPLADAPGLWLVQGAWLAGLLLASRLVFRVAVRKLTVQGG